MLRLINAVSLVHGGTQMIKATFALLLSIVAGLSQMVTASDAVLIEFSQQSCPPCQAMVPVIGKLEEAGVPIRRVDVGREQELAGRYGIRQTPTYLVYSGGRERARMVGAQSLDDLQAALQRSATPSLKPTRSLGSESKDSAKPQTRLASVEVASEPMASAAAADGIERARAATVRLRVFDDQGYGAGTGTIVHTHGSEALVLTCGHLFRETKGKGKVEVDVYSHGEVHTVPGQVIDYDAEHRDIGLVAIRVPVSVQPVAVSASDDAVRTGDSVFSFGCDRGADPSRRDTRITGVNKYNQHVKASNFEIAGAPIDGRSGGGLFDQKGRLIGVCNSADYEGDIGIYTGPGSIRWQFDRVDLADLYQENATPNSDVSSDAVVLQEAAPEPAPQATAAESLAQLNPASQQPTDDQQIIVILREAGQNRMLTLNNPSSELRRLLDSESTRLR